MIGIIGAMDSEIDAIKNKLESVELKVISGMEFYEGTYKNKEIILVKCNEGKVNAAIATQTLILKYFPEYIINVGVAGAIEDKLRVASVVIADKTVEFDLDTTILGYELGYVFGLNRIFVDTDRTLTDLVYNISSKITDSYIGTVASSEKFITKKEDKEILNNKFGALAVDMETASINHVCKLNNVKFTSIRVISDNSNSIEFREFLNIALKKLNLIIFDVLDNI